MLIWALIPLVIGLLMLIWALIPLAVGLLVLVSALAVGLLRRRLFLCRHVGGDGLHGGRIILFRLHAAVFVLVIFHSSNPFVPWQTAAFSL